VREREEGRKEGRKRWAYICKFQFVKRRFKDASDA
jgi:hypothetical protein